MTNELGNMRGERSIGIVVLSALLVLWGGVQVVQRLRIPMFQDPTVWIVVGLWAITSGVGLVLLKRWGYWLAIGFVIAGVIHSIVQVLAIWRRPYFEFTPLRLLLIMSLGDATPALSKGQTGRRILVG